MMKRISLVLAALLITSVSSAKMTVDEVAFMQATIAKEQEKVNAQQVFVGKLQAEVAKKQQAVAINKGAVRAAQWTTIPIATLELAVLAKGLSDEGFRAFKFLVENKNVRGSKINIRKQVIVASLAMAAYYGSDAYNQSYVVVQTQDLGQLQSQLVKALEILSTRQVALSNMQTLLNEQM